jgi:hypothetical protein
MFPNAQPSSRCAERKKQEVSAVTGLSGGRNTRKKIRMKSANTENSSNAGGLSLPKSLALKNKKGFSRRHLRHDCVLIGTMKVIDIGAEFDGALLEISRGGCSFRQASMFVMDRLNELVLIHTEFFEAEGRIRAVRADGYGIQFFDEVDEGVINRIVEEYGFKVSESFLAKRN